MNIKNLIAKLISNYETNDPIGIASDLNMIVLFENLGAVKGYYDTAFQRKFIHVNKELPSYEQNFTVAHELGHAILHPNTNTLFLKSKTFFSINKLEIEANRFAVELLIPDDEFHEHFMNEYSISQIANIYGLHPKLVELKFA